MAWKSLSKNRKKALHTHAKDKFFQQVLNRDGYKCCWCRVEVIRNREIDAMPPHLIIERTCDAVEYIDAQHIGTIKKAIATLDHVLPLAHGGRNKMSNLVVACHACNRKRNEEQVKAQRSGVRA